MTGALLLERAQAFNHSSGLVSPEDQTWENPLELMCAINRKMIRTPALELVAATWAEEMSKPDGSLIIMMPPQEGKTMTTSRGGILWLLNRDPSLRIILASYQPGLSQRISRDARNDIVVNSGGPGVLDLGIRLSSDRAAVKEWVTTEGGGLLAVGVDTAVTGAPADAFIIDDPLKGRQSAESHRVRENFQDWWRANGSSRLAPGAPVCLTLTRWHYDDPAGWLLKEMDRDWRVLHIPAQADPEVVDPDPLGRAPGEFMVSARGRSQADWLLRKKSAGDEWDALYQGDPRSPSGKVFDVTMLRYWHPTLDGRGIVCGQREWLYRDLYRYITIDTATSTSTSADYTVAVVNGVTPHGDLVVLDMVRARVPPHEQIGLARPLIDRWSPDTTYVEASLRSTQLVRDAAAEEIRVSDLVADKSKQLRAAPLASLVKQQRVWFPAEHACLEDAKSELEKFPHDRHDDMVDALAYGAIVARTTGALSEVAAPEPPDPYAYAGTEQGMDYDRQQW